jgi:hypothetical protein
MYDEVRKAVEVMVPGFGNGTWNVLDARETRRDGSSDLPGLVSVPSCRVLGRVYPGR